MTDRTARLDHVVLWVSDPVASAEFYLRTLGTEPVRLAEFIAGQAPFPSVRLNEDTIVDLMARDRAEGMRKLFPEAAESAGHPVNHVCVALSAEAFDTLVARLAEDGVPASEISHGSFGARGPAKRSFYFRDPDGNVFEARHYD
ncbi:VOC family protein [Streptomyces sp. NPDC048002]|uniref:VOC family protein n=1 Tax=unclassified Streptomyces TaxID=2593676 RepID=UPI00340D18B4